MLQERGTESIYQEIAISRMRQKRRFALYLTMKCIYPRDLDIQILEYFLFLQAMSEKIERMEFDLESRDKVP